MVTINTCIFSDLCLYTITLDLIATPHVQHCNTNSLICSLSKLGLYGSFNLSLQEEVLAKVVAKQMSLGEMKEAAGKYRALQTIKKCFCRCTNTTWNEAVQKYPRHTSEARLSQFLSLNFKNVPESFVVYCQSAIQTTSPDHLESVYVVGHDSSTVSNTTISDSGVPFNGYNLFVAAIPEVHVYIHMHMYSSYF